MEKSIESIWKNNKSESQSIKTPTLEDLQKLKSQHVVDKFEMTFKVNIKAILIGSIIFLGLSFLIRTPYTGISFFFLANAFAYFNYKLMQGLYKIDKNVSSYDYLKSFDNWLKEMVSINTKIHRFLYPLFIFFMFLGFWLGSIGGDIPGQVFANEFMEQYPDIPTLFNVPFFIPVGLGVIMLTLGVLAKVIYKWDYNVIYGRLTKKLSALILELETLRAEVH
ncbi:MAG: hypothetical protein JXQ87_11690 [Bacteroidia bacterium]